MENGDNQGRGEGALVMTHEQLENLMLVRQTHTDLWFSVARTQFQSFSKEMEVYGGWKNYRTGQVLGRVQRRVYFLRSCCATLELLEQGTGKTGGQRVSTNWLIQLGPESRYYLGYYLVTLSSSSMIRAFPDYVGK